MSHCSPCVPSQGPGSQGGAAACSLTAGPPAPCPGLCRSASDVSVLPTGRSAAAAAEQSAVGLEQELGNVKALKTKLGMARFFLTSVLALVFY